MNEGEMNEEEMEEGSRSSRTRRCDSSASYITHARG